VWIVLPALGVSEIKAPRISIKLHASKESMIAKVEVQIEKGSIGTWQAKGDERAGNEGCRVNNVRVVLGDIDYIGLCGKDFNVAVILHHLLLWRACERLRGLRLGAKPLHRIHNILLLVGESSPDGLGPIHVPGHHLNCLGGMNDRFDGGVPRLIVNIIVGGSGIILQPLAGGGDILRIGRGGENFRKQRIGIKSNWTEHLVELVRRINNRLCGAWIGSDRRSRRVARRVTLAETGGGQGNNHQAGGNTGEKAAIFIVVVNGHDWRHLISVET
jgi:hypothetical protein